MNRFGLTAVLCLSFYCSPSLTPGPCWNARANLGITTFPKKLNEQLVCNPGIDGSACAYSIWFPGRYV
ncbi:hypothetical protein HZ326_23666 [Fusarium oxysporum f. sp. albedinis]|nr:hypothetical protein HZ326_23666 [Fusarium oxysporum f. sp. albedinis]